MDFSEISYHDVKFLNEFPTINYKKVSIKTPEMVCRYGIENEYGNLMLKLSLNDKDYDLFNLKGFLEGMEKKYAEHLSIDGDKLKSCIRDDMLICRISQFKGKIATKFKSDRMKMVSKDDIEDGVRVRCVLDYNKPYRIANDSSKFSAMYLLTVKEVEIL